MSRSALMRATSSETARLDIVMYQFYHHRFLISPLPFEVVSTLIGKFSPDVSHPPVHEFGVFQRKGDGFSIQQLVTCVMERTLFSFVISSVPLVFRENGVYFYIVHETSLIHFVFDRCHLPSSAGARLLRLSQ